MNKPATQKKDNSFKNDFTDKKLTPSITSQIQVSTTWKPHMCFVHAHHKNTSSIKITFKSLTVSQYHYTYKHSDKKRK